MIDALPDSIRDLVATGPLVHLTTLNADGSPQVSVVWMGIDAGELVCGHMHETQKVRNVRRDGRVAVSFLGTGSRGGLHEYAVGYGTARITEGGAADLLQRLAHTYLGPGVEFPPEAVRSRPGFITRIRPDRFTGLGPWADG